MAAPNPARAPPNWNNIIDGFGEITNGLGHIHHALGQIVPELPNFEAALAVNAVRLILSRLSPIYCVDQYQYSYCHMAPSIRLLTNPSTQQINTRLTAIENTLTEIRNMLAAFRVECVY